jgi:hypothetical protein
MPKYQSIIEEAMCVFYDRCRRLVRMSPTTISAL